MSDNTVRLIIELENRVKAQLKQIQQQIYDIQKATNFARVNFNNSVARSNMTLGKLQQTLKSVGVWGQTSFNQLSAAQRRTLLEMAQMDPKARNIMQRLNEIGITGKSTFQQLTQSEKNALTEMYSLAQSVTYATTNFSQFGINVKAAQIALQQLNNNSNFQNLNTSLQSAKVKVSSLGVDINSTKGKIMSLGIAAKEAIGGGFSQGISLGKTKLSELSASVSSAKAKLAGFYNSTKTAGGGLGFLRTAASMTVGMIGFDLVNSMVQGARESINAAASFERFGQRLGMTEGELQQFHGAVDKMQDSFRKVDMNAVGAAALEMGVKLKLPKQSMEELTKTTAVMSSAFVKEGRTQEDAILAVSDAMDGQFRRLQELGISQDMLMKNGWDGDINNKTGLLQAMNKTLDDMGFTQTAQEIVTLDDAWAALTVTGSKLIQSVLDPITPIIIAVVEMITWMVEALQSAWSSMPDWAQTAVTVAIFAGAILLVMGYISSLGGVLAILGSALAPLIPIILGISAPMIAIVAIIAAIAFAVYEVGIAFGWWKDVGTMLEAIKNNIGRLWDAFINHPDVKATIKSIQDAWTDLNESLKPVVDWLKGIWDEIFPESAKGKVDGTRAIIDAIGLVFESFRFRVQLVINILTIVWDVFNGIASLLRGDFTGALSFFTDAWNVLLEVLSPIAEFLESTLGPSFESFFATISVFVLAWQLVINVLQIIWNTIGQVIGIFQSFLTGQISLSQALTLIWQTILQMYAQILSTIISTVRSWANQLGNNAVKAGSNFVYGVINWLTKLPGGAQTYLLAVVARIISAGAQWVSNAKTKAAQVVTGVILHINKLPGKVGQEFLNIGLRMLSEGSQLVENAKQIGKKIVNGMLSAMGIHSPGIIQEKVVTEFINMLKRVKDKGKSAYDYGKNVGENIVNGFNTADVENALNNISTNITTPITTNTEVETDEANVDLSNNDSGTEETGEQYNGLVEEVALASESITLSNNAIGTSFSTLTAGIALNTGAIQMRIAGVVTSFQTTRNGVNTALNSMKNSNTQAWNNIKTTTSNNLNQIHNSTLDVTNKMTNAWGVMKDNIVSAAGSIQTQSYNKFSSLHRSIASFYNQLASAHFSSGLPAGPAHNSRGLIGGRTLPGGSINFGKSTKGKISNYAAGGLGQGKSKFIDTNSKVKHSQNNKSKAWLNILDYNLPTNVIDDLTRINGCSNPRTCFAGIPDTHVNKIMNTAYKGRIADPWFLEFKYLPITM